MAKGRMYVEKREHERADKTYQITYKLIPKEITSQPMKTTGITKDISLGGVRVEGEVIGKQGDVLRVEIKTEKSPPTVVFAEIKWIIEDKKQFGLEFLALRDDDNDALEEILNR